MFGGKIPQRACYLVAGGQVIRVTVKPPDPLASANPWVFEAARSLLRNPRGHQDLVTGPG